MERKKCLCESRVFLRDEAISMLTEQVASQKHVLNQAEGTLRKDVLLHTFETARTKSRRSTY